MKRTLLCLLGLCALLCVASCGSRNVIHEQTRESRRLEAQGAYDVAKLEVTFKPHQDWEVTEEEWSIWVTGWRGDYKKELMSECYKEMHFIDAAGTATRPVVTCEIYEMDKGGSFGVGGAGFARANVKIVDPKSGEVWYDGKLEGKGSSGVFETATAQGRFKFSVLSLARQIADLMETGSPRKPD
ncbi:MAG: hypothetical protein KF696_04310 [Planctomycetes bacterium]|nr:hypothetical protein [Planctomycetota bacterium]MCW8134196.1 hypothetical protein [Planctomycetota bacterium]